MSVKLYYRLYRSIIRSTLGYFLSSVSIFAILPVLNVFCYVLSSRVGYVSFRGLILRLGIFKGIYCWNVGFEKLNHKHELSLLTLLCRCGMPLCVVPLQCLSTPHFTFLSTPSSHWLITDSIMYSSPNLCLLLWTNQWIMTVTWTYNALTKRIKQPIINNDYSIVRLFLTTAYKVFVYLWGMNS